MFTQLISLKLLPVKYTIFNIIVAILCFFPKLAYIIYKPSVLFLVTKIVPVLAIIFFIDYCCLVLRYYYEYVDKKYF